MVRQIKLRHAAGNGPKALLTRRIAVILAETPFQSAQQISPRLGVPDATAMVVLRLLQSEPDLFEICGPEQPPIWAVRVEAEAQVESWRTVVNNTGDDRHDEQMPGAPTAPKTCYAGPPLRAWQSEALYAWMDHGRRGLVEAVTGSGKTTVGARAIAMALDEGRSAVVLVPGVDLQNQWFERLRRALPSHRIDRLGGNGPARPPDRWDVLVATVQTASRTPIPAPAGALLVADEVHRYGAGTFAKALLVHYEWRLGLTATLERSDNSVEEILLPYFGTLVPGCDYARAQSDAILAPVKVALVGVHFTARERARYDRADEVARKSRNLLVEWYGAPEEPFGEFMKYTQLLAKDDRGEGVRHAQRFLKYFAERREVLADCAGKLELVRSLPITELAATQSIVFTERTGTAEAVSATLLESGLACGYIGSTLKSGERAGVLDEFRSGALRALAAPRVLDEGIDVPDAQVGVVLAASRTRRQMIQRMGRVVRPKSDGRTAIFVIAHVFRTPEDPALGAHEAFLEDLEFIADERRTVDAAELGPLLRSWLTPPPGAPATATSPNHPTAVATQPDSRAPLPTPLEMMARMPTRVITPSRHPSPEDDNAPPQQQTSDETADHAEPYAPSGSETVVPEPDTPLSDIVPAQVTAATNENDAPPVAGSAPAAQALAPAVASGAANLAQLGAKLGLADASALWAKARTARPWVDPEWEASRLLSLTRSRNRDDLEEQAALRVVVDYATESPDPIGQFGELTRSLGLVGSNRTELLVFVATLRGVDPVDLL
ncbi:DEAD/DEAH box helicase [Nocardia crassostreae]|uniref:DEAD/DEAH box helicase n=1 Tax=Nocardia crassostreae TaxID=53428 RepID=UPI000B2DF33B|nr:DEAD/DEAH box helicase [Nocardia crassostreae]